MIWRSEAELGARFYIQGAHLYGSMLVVSSWIWSQEPSGSQSHLQSLSRKDITKCCWCTEKWSNSPGSLVHAGLSERVISALCFKERISWVTVEKAFVADVSGAHCTPGCWLPGPIQVYFCTCSLYLQNQAPERFSAWGFWTSQKHMQEAAVQRINQPHNFSLSDWIELVDK